MVALRLIVYRAAYYSPRGTWERSEEGPSWSLSWAPVLFSSGPKAQGYSGFQYFWCVWYTRGKFYTQWGSLCCFKTVVSFFFEHHAIYGRSHKSRGSSWKSTRKVDGTTQKYKASSRQGCQKPASVLSLCSCRVGVHSHLIAQRGLSS